MVNYIVLFLMFAVLGVLVLGIISMARGSNPERSNQLMMWRVGLQAIALLMLGLFMAKG